MSKHRNSQRFDIIRQDVVASQQGGARLPRAEQRQAATRACAEIDISALARAPHQINDVALDRRRDIHLADLVDGFQQIL